MNYIGIFVALTFILINVKTDNITEPYRSIVIWMQLISMFGLCFAYVGFTTIGMIINGRKEKEQKKKLAKQQMELSAYKAEHKDDIEFYNEFINRNYDWKKLPYVYRGFDFYVVNAGHREGLWYYCKNQTYSLHIGFIGRFEQTVCVTAKDALLNLRFAVEVVKTIKRRVEIAKTKIDKHLEVSQ